jgi:hypothetical protein
MRRAVALAFVIAPALLACGNSSPGPSKAQIVAACTHVCQCETNTTDTSCQTTCDAAPSGAPAASASWTSVHQGSFGSFYSSLSSDPFNVVDQACLDCFTAAACTGILAGTACVSECM